MNDLKISFYTEQQEQLANMAKALGHPARVAIVDYLLKVNACICGDIVDELPLAQSTISQHLKVLKEAGIIKGSIEGNAICYCLDEKIIQIIQHYLSNIISTINQQNCC